MCINAPIKLGVSKNMRIYTHEIEGEGENVGENWMANTGKNNGTTLQFNV